MAPDKILLFSADDSLTHKITHTLVEAGFEVANSDSGILALETIQAESPVLIILDIGLPGINSLAIIRNLRSAEKNRNTPLILLGDNLREDDVLLGIEVGADLCLLEAFYPPVFIARVRSLLRRVEATKTQ